MIPLRVLHFVGGSRVILDRQRGVELWKVQEPGQSQVEHHVGDYQAPYRVDFFPIRERGSVHERIVDVVAEQKLCLALRDAPVIQVSAVADGDLSDSVLVRE